ncbi:ATP-dependent Clp protease proteolytic subunit [Candidatus Nomurabacteria bacterium]|nr:ATP-dependent Clp protease proteolytic subunit [Candidatus Nomurabacteria bacterium]
MEKYIIFEGNIDQQATLQLVNAIQKVSNAIPQANKIVIIFSSMGGNIYDGFLLASFIQNSRIPIAIHAVNHIDSIANVVYLSAKERTAESHAKFYMHGASTQGNFDEKALKEQLSSIKTNNSRIAHFVSENSGIGLKKVTSMMESGTTISAQEALKYKIVKNIIHLEVPSDAVREEIIYVN